MNNTLRYLAIALLISTSVQAAETSYYEKFVNFFNSSTESVEVEATPATVPAEVPATIEVPAVDVPAPTYLGAIKSYAVQAKAATVDAVKSGKTMATNGTDKVVAIVKAHPAKFAVGTVAVAAIAVYAISKWKKAARRKAALKEEEALTA
jgi:hypothetical protein